MQVNVKIFVCYTRLQKPGCSEGYVTVDGNEYLKRSKCQWKK